MLEVVLREASQDRQDIWLRYIQQKDADINGAWEDITESIKIRPQRV